MHCLSPSSENLSKFHQKIIKLMVELLTYRTILCRIAYLSDASVAASLSDCLPIGIECAFFLQLSLSLLRPLLLHFLVLSRLPWLIFAVNAASASVLLLLLRRWNSLWKATRKTEASCVRVWQRPAVGVFNSPHSAGEQGVMGFHSVCSCLPNLHMQAFRSPRLCRRPPQIRFKNRSKIDLKFRTPKSAELGQKWAQMGAQNRPNLA